VPGAYAAPAVFAVASEDGSEHYTLERTPAVDSGVARGAGPSPTLAPDVESAVGEDGVPVRFETPPPPPGSGGGRAAVTASAAGGGEAPAGGAGDQPVSGTVRGATVRVRFFGPRASAEQAERLLRTLNGPG
jgi:hypothetical protein